MKFSEQWLRGWVSPQVSSDELVARLSMAGLEVDSVTPAAGVFSGVVVGEVPESLRGNFTERDGHNDRTVLVFPSLAIGYDDARNVVAFADRVAAAQFDYRHYR